MTFDEYQKFCQTTAVYPAGEKIKYPALGLAEEAGEVAGQVKRVLRDDGGKVTDERRAKLLAELGDVLYYVAQLGNDVGISLEDVVNYNVAKLTDRKQRGKLHGEGGSR